MSEISTRTVDKIDEVEQIILLTIYRVNLHFFRFSPKKIPKIPPPFITFARVCENESLAKFNENRAVIIPLSFLADPYWFSECFEPCSRYLL